MKIKKLSCIGTKALALLASAFMMFNVVACSGGSDDDDSPSTPVNPDSSSKTGTEIATVTVGDYEAPSISGSFYPAADSTDAFVDTDLYVVYDSDITVDRNSTAKITISDGTNTDEIAVSGETYDVDGCNKVTASVKVNKELVMASGNVLVIKPHSILTAGTKYTVTVPEGIVTGQTEKSWSFTPKAMNTPTNNTITVGTDCASINGAIKTIGSSATGDWTINVPEGSYHEILGYYGSANLTIVGAEGDYGTKSKVFWNNSQALGNSQRTRQSFIWEGGNLTIKNMTFRNTANRAEEGNVNIQAETLYFDCKADLVVYNSSFTSYQDTLLIGNNGGRAWFYKCYIAGDVDFIWGYADVALFEKCQIECLADGIKNDAKIFASRTVYSTSKTAKGFVLFNSAVKIQDGCNAAYGRSSGADTQASVINCTFTTTGAGKLATGLWGSASDTRAFEANGDMAVGYKDYGNTLNGSAVDTSSRTANTADMSERLVNREYNGRYTILNRYYDPDAGAYKDNSSEWDISAYESEFSAESETSVENIYVEPVYTKDVVGGNTVQLTPSTTSSSTLTYTYSSSDTSIATVDANGLVTAATGVTGSATITVTASNGSKDYATVDVIASRVDVESIAIEADSSVDAYALNTVTATFTPADATVQLVTWTATGNVKIVDPSSKTLVTTLESTSAEIQVEGLVPGGSGTITAVAVDNASATASKNITITSVRDYNAVEGVNVNSMDETKGCGILNFQGKVGMWHDLYVEGKLGSSNGKICASGERVQSRLGTIYIPVTANCYIDMTCQKFNDTNVFASDFADLAGNAPTTYEDENAETYKYHYRWELDVTNDTAKLKSGSDVLALYNAATKDTNRSWTNHTPDSNAKYFGIVIPANDRYWTHITITEDASIQHEAASAELSIETDFTDSSVTLDLNGTTSVTQTVTGASSDGATPTVTYSTDNSSAVSVNSSTGEVTATGIGVATITATVAHPSDSNVTKVTSTYTVLVKDTEVTSGYAINFTGVAGATSSGSWDFGKFSATGAKYHGGTYGWVWSAAGTLTVHVTGSSSITLYNSYTNGAGNAAVTATAGTVTSSFTTTKGDYKSSPVEFVLDYEGDEADITVTFAGETYLSKIAVVDASYSSTVSANTLFDLRDIFSALPTTGSAASGSVKATGGEISYTAMYYKDTTHGAYMYKTSTISFTVSGACTIWLGKDSYNGATYTIASTADGLSATEIDAGIQNTDSAATLASDVTDLTSDGAAAVSFEYTGSGETTITISVTGQSTTNYLPAVQVVF